MALVDPAEEKDGSDNDEADEEEDPDSPDLNRPEDKAAKIKKLTD